MKSNFIGGAWVDGASAVDNINPSDTRDVIGAYAQADAAQARSAVDAAAAAFGQWSLSTPQQRFEVLDKVGSELLLRKEELGDLLLAFAVEQIGCAGVGTVLALAARADDGGAGVSVD